MVSTGSQFIKTPGYIQITGRLNQVGIGLTPDDEGVGVLPVRRLSVLICLVQGELDPHGADLVVHPLLHPTEICMS
jgi:hypothetical protein